MRLLHNLTEDQFIRASLGNSHLPWRSLIPMTAVYTIFVIFGILGNVATCLVIIKNEYMKTATNIYLLNLALTDIATLLIALPMEVFQMWHQYPWTLGEFACDAKIVITEAITYASILTIVAFTTERYQAICKPNAKKFKGKQKRRHTASRLIIIIWITSLITALPWSYFTKVNYLQFKGKILLNSAWCSVPFDENTGSLYMTLACTLVFFILPIIIVTILYIRIARSFSQKKRKVVLKRDSITTLSEDIEKYHKMYTHGRKVVIRMLLVVVCAFFICWAPFHAQRLLFMLVTLKNAWNKQLMYVQYVLYILSGVLYYFNSIFHPLVYSLMSKRFRRAFRDIKRNIPYCGKAPEVKCAQNTTVLSSRSKSEWKEIESDSGLAMSISISRSYPGEGVTSGYLTQTTREKNTAPARM